MKKILILGLVLIMACCLFLTGCNDSAGGEASKQEIAQKGIQMKNYLTLYTRGTDGHAKLYADLDLIALKKDCAEFLVDDITDVPEQVFRYSKAKSAEEHLEYVFKAATTNSLVKLDNCEKLSNGDVVNVTVSSLGDLEKILSVPISGARFQHTIKGLEKFNGLDPFERTCFLYDRLVGVDGKVGYELSSSADLLIVLPDGTYEFVGCPLALDEDRVYMPGDSVHLAMDEEDVDRFVNKYGKNIFTRTEAEVKVERIAQLPTGSGARDIFKYIDEPCFDNVDYATKAMMDNATETQTAVERIGMMFFYDDAENLEQRDDEYKFYNQIVFIYKVTNETHPEGWYSYMAYNGYVTSLDRFNWGTLEFEKSVGNAYGESLDDDFRYYQNEHPRMYGGEFPSTFEYEDCQYPGHTNLADVFTAIMTNMRSVEEYDHLVVTDTLKTYINEY